MPERPVLRAVEAAAREATAGEWGSMRVADLLPGSFDTWAEEEAAIRSRLCLCCGLPGRYQEELEAHLAANGFEGMGIYVENGRVKNGNHRVIAARNLGIETIPTETKEQAGERWLRDHGPVGWLGRTRGDISPEEMSWVTFDALRRVTP